MSSSYPAVYQAGFANAAGVPASFVQHQPSPGMHCEMVQPAPRVGRQVQWQSPANHQATTGAIVHGSRSTSSSTYSSLSSAQAHCRPWPQQEYAGNSFAVPAPPPRYPQSIPLKPRPQFQFSGQAQAQGLGQTRPRAALPRLQYQQHPQPQAVLSQNSYTVQTVVTSAFGRGISSNSYDSGAMSQKPFTQYAVRGRRPGASSARVVNGSTSSNIAQPAFRLGSIPGGRAGYSTWKAERANQSPEYDPSSSSDSSGVDGLERKKRRKKTQSPPENVSGGESNPHLYAYSGAGNLETPLPPPPPSAMIADSPRYQPESPVSMVPANAHGAVSEREREGQRPSNNPNANNSWMIRTRSPTPKLPTSVPPLKRRKIDHPPAVHYPHPHSISPQSHEPPPPPYQTYEHEHESEQIPIPPATNHTRTVSAPMITVTAMPFPHHLMPPPSSFPQYPSDPTADPNPSPPTHQQQPLPDRGVGRLVPVRNEDWPAPGPPSQSQVHPPPPPPPLSASQAGASYATTPGVALSLPSPSTFELPPPAPDPPWLQSSQPHQQQQRQVQQPPSAPRPLPIPGRGQGQAQGGTRTRHRIKLEGDPSSADGKESESGNFFQSVLRKSNIHVKMEDEDVPFLGHVFKAEKKEEGLSPLLLHPPQQLASSSSSSSATATAAFAIQPSEPGHSMLLPISIDSTSAPIDVDRQSDLNVALGVGTGIEEGSSRAVSRTQAQSHATPPSSSSSSERKLVTSSSVYYPYPIPCRKAHLDHKENRKAFFKEKMLELMAKGLKKEKAYTRDEGLVIEWTSPIPVWSDTLSPGLPDIASTIELAYKLNASVSPGRGNADAVDSGGETSLNGGPVRKRRGRPKGSKNRKTMASLVSASAPASALSPGPGSISGWEPQSQSQSQDGIYSQINVQPSSSSSTVVSAIPTAATPAGVEFRASAGSAQMITDTYEDAYEREEGTPETDLELYSGTQHGYGALPTKSRSSLRLKSLSRMSAGASPGPGVMSKKGKSKTPASSSSVHDLQSARPSGFFIDVDGTPGALSSRSPDSGHDHAQRSVKAPSLPTPAPEMTGKDGVHAHGTPTLISAPVAFLQTPPSSQPTSQASSQPSSQPSTQQIPSNTMSRPRPLPLPGRKRLPLPGRTHVVSDQMWTPVQKVLATPNPTPSPTRGTPAQTQPPQAEVQVLELALAPTYPQLAAETTSLPVAFLPRQSRFTTPTLQSQQQQSTLSPLASVANAQQQKGQGSVELATLSSDVSVSVEGSTNSAAAMTFASAELSGGNNGSNKGSGLGGGVSESTPPASSQVSGALNSSSTAPSPEDPGSSESQTESMAESGPSENVDVVTETKSRAATPIFGPASLNTPMLENPASSPTAPKSPATSVAAVAVSAKDPSLSPLSSPFRNVLDVAISNFPISPSGELVEGSMAAAAVLLPSPSLSGSTIEAVQVHESKEENDGVQQVSPPSPPTQADVQAEAQSQSQMEAELSGRTSTDVAIESSGPEVEMKDDADVADSLLLASPEEHASAGGSSAGVPEEGAPARVESSDAGADADADMAVGGGVGAMDVAADGEVDAEADEDDVEGSVSTDGGEVVALVTEFLQRFCQLFDADRSALEMAYASEALFTCRRHDFQDSQFVKAGLSTPPASPTTTSTVTQGRTQIVNKLLGLGPYVFCPRGKARDLHFDAVVVDPPSSFSFANVSNSGQSDILLTVHGEIVSPHVDGVEQDHILALDQSFLLRRPGSVGMGMSNEESGAGAQGANEDGDTGDGNCGDSHLDGSAPREGVKQGWPLIAISHQMTVRAPLSFNLERLEEDLPWVSEILE